MEKGHLQDLYKRAVAAMGNAYNPYSQYYVGASLVTTKGTIYAGCNVENAAYGLTLCAEATTIGSMVASEGPVGIKELLLVASGDTFPSPCGACRQRIAEFSTPETMVHFARARESGKGFDVRTYRMATLLPLSFTQTTMWDTPEKKSATQDVKKESNTQVQV